jgi:pSer/pThr/pTyr-binding forkhead associated (FHA) protein
MRKSKAKSRTQVINGVSADGGAIIGVRGYLQGRIIELRDNVPCTIGRDPQMCDLVIMNENVSRVHCRIYFDPNMKMYVVNDNSTNGVLIQNGQWTHRGDTVAVPRGTHIAIGTQSDEILLR